jgi:hypothetical protein
MRKSLLIVAGLLGFALLTGSVTRSSQALAGPGTIRITSRDIQISLNNHGAPSRGAGDILAIRQLLFNKGIRKRAIGRSELVCTYTGTRSRQCSGTFLLPRGTIVVSGSLRYREFFELAIVGGTSLYDNVRGSMTATMYTRRPHREILVFRLLI